MFIVFGFFWFAWNELARVPPAQVANISSLAVPIVGFVSGMLVLGETPRPFDYVPCSRLWPQRVWCLSRQSSNDGAHSDAHPTSLRHYNAFVSPIMSGRCPMTQRAGDDEMLTASINSGAFSPNVARK